ncbi:MAG: 3-methyl-2-oxobutanoate hydroxymethyltransferase [Porphyromonas sp.]|nr:3-methyl-2-oxobutanoate hydroxymethyltransferase [Porphyromonas sp.]
MAQYLSTDKKKITATRYTAMKASGEKITMVTAYDYTMAKLIDMGGVDSILVGDSASNVMIGNATTLPITLDQMIYHARCVANGVKYAFVIADMPFGTINSDVNASLHAAIRMMKESGVDAIKIEGGAPIRPALEAIISAGIPVVGHLGLTPQSVHQLGGYGVQAREEKEAEQLLKDGKMLEEVGCTALVLEKIPAGLASQLSKELSIPTIGIGAGSGTDGQVLVGQDMLGMTQGFKPKFLRHFAQVGDVIISATEEYCRQVKEGLFPSEEESYN